MARLEPWEHLERDVRERLGLDATTCSGNKFFDSGDAVDNRADSPWPLWVDAKHTVRKAFPVAFGEIDALHRRAQGLGKRFALAVRFNQPKTTRGSLRVDHDYVLIPMDDFEELLTMAGVLKP